MISVTPIPQRACGVPGGRYLADGIDVTGNTYASARIHVDPDTDRPSLTVADSLSDSLSPTLSPGRTIRANMFRRSAGWQWQDRDPVAPDASTLVSLETSTQHLYALAADIATPVTLARYTDAPSEPRLRPTTRGSIAPGNVIGHIAVRGRSHPVYDRLTVH